MTPAHGPPDKKLRPPIRRLGCAIFAAKNRSIWTYPRCCGDVGGYSFNAVADGEAVAAVADGVAVAAVADGDAASEDAVDDLHPGAAGTEDVLRGGRVPIILLAQTKLKRKFKIKNRRLAINIHYVKRFMCA